MRQTYRQEIFAGDRVEIPVSPYALALWNLIIRPPRRRYDAARLGPKEFQLWSCAVERVDVILRNPRGMNLKCSHWLPVFAGDDTHEGQQRPVVVYLHQNASCRLEALALVPMFLPLGISVFALDFAGCGESDGEYVSLGWYERDDLAECVKYLREIGNVSAIGLWGRSMGAVTALLHADRDHSIGGMVLDSPFSNLRQLATELAQSDHLAVKVPTWLLDAAIAVGRLRIQSLCGFDIDKLVPDAHVGASFIPAMFVAAVDDDFVAPHHTQRLHNLYTGDKELEMVPGDHNSPRGATLNRKALVFLCRALLCDIHPPPSRDGSLLRLFGLDSLATDVPLDNPLLARRLLQGACRTLATAGDPKAWIGDSYHGYPPMQVEGALQLCDPEAQAGFCCSFIPRPSEWGGILRPPMVLFAYVCTDGLHVSRAREAAEARELVHIPSELQLGVPVLCILEFTVRPSRLRLKLGDVATELILFLEEECEAEVYIWPMAKLGEAQFFDVALSDLMPIPGTEVESAPLASGSQMRDRGGLGAARGGSGSITAVPEDYSQFGVTAPNGDAAQVDATDAVTGLASQPGAREEQGSAQFCWQQ